MNKAARGLALLAILGFALIARAAEPVRPEGGVRKKSPQRLVEVQWEVSEGAVKYIVEVRHFQGNLLKTFTSKNPLLRFKAPVGDYELRAKVENDDGRVGPFSGWTRVVVLPKKVELEALAKAHKVLRANADPKRLTGEIKLAWPAEETAKKYQLKIFRKDGTLFKELSLERPAAAIELPPGEFHYSVTTVGNENLASAEVISPQVLIVGNARLPAPQIVSGGDKVDAAHPAITWEAVPGVAYKVNLEYRPFLGDVFQPVAPTEVVKEGGQWTLPENSKPGEYRWTLWAEAENWRASPPVREYFVIKPTEPRLSGIEADIDQTMVGL